MRYFHGYTDASATGCRAFYVNCARLSAAAVLAYAGSIASAQQVDRYRCFPADDSHAYTVPSVCRGESVRREPLSPDEMKALWEIKTRGRSFFRCTAPDGRYSRSVKKDEPCPSSADQRTVEYARKPLHQLQREQEMLNDAIASLYPAQPPVNPSPPPALNPSPPADTRQPTRSPVVISSAPPASAATPATVSAAPVTVAPHQPAVGNTEQRSDSSSWSSPLVWLGLLIAGVLLWRGIHRRKTDAPQQRQKPSRQPTRSSAPERRRTAQSAHPSHAGEEDMNQKAQQLLAVLTNPRAASSLPGGLAFGRALQQARLDYSMESLERTDRLLAKIREKCRPQRKNWYQQPGAENFSLLLAFYLGTIIERQSGHSISWYTREQTAPLMPSDSPLPDASWARLVGIVAASACVPLGLIEDTLFAKRWRLARATTCQAYVERFLHRLPPASVPDMDDNQHCSSMHETFFSDAPIHNGQTSRHTPKAVPSSTASIPYGILQRDTPALDEPLNSAVYQAGIAAAWSMFLAEGGSDGTPRILVPGADGKSKVVDFGFYDGANAACQAADSRMESNPDHAAYQVLSVDGFASLPTERTDALTIELRVYEKIPADQVAFHMSIICPYRNANHPKGFAIYSPRLVESSAGKEMHNALFKRFYEGIVSFTVQNFDWMKYLDESI